jgi:hypothetical protein
MEERIGISRESMPAPGYLLDYISAFTVPTYSYLLQGGNPLDFNFAHLETVGVHSASLTNQVEAQTVIR